MNFDLPEGWAIARLDELIAPGGIFDGPFGSSLKTSDYTESGVRVVRLENLANMRFIEDKRTYVSKAKYADLIRHSVGEGDVLFGSFVDGATRVCLLPKLGVAAIAKADCFTIRPRREILDARFLVYQLGANAARDSLTREIHGATRPRINTKQLRAFEIALPPLREQQRIAAKVQELLTQIDAAKDRLAKVPAVLKRFRQSVIGAACAGKLTEDWRAKSSPEPVERTLARIAVSVSNTGRTATEEVIPGKWILSVGKPDKSAPPGWKWVPLTDIAKLESGHTPSRQHPEYWNGGIPWISIPDARASHGGIIRETIGTISSEGLANSAARLLPKDTVCLCRTAASIGYVFRLGRPMTTSQDFVNWVCSEAIEPEFLAYALMAEGTDISRFGRGSTHTTIYFPEVKALHICLPPVDEQREIVRRIVGLLPLADDIAATVDRAAQRAARLTQAILAKAFRGELVPTEADLAVSEGRTYEAADQLLARARTEAQSPAKPTARQPRKHPGSPSDVREARQLRSEQGARRVAHWGDKDRQRRGEPA